MMLVYTLATLTPTLRCAKSEVVESRSQWILQTNLAEAVDRKLASLPDQVGG